MRLVPSIFLDACAENFGQEVESVCLALLAVTGAWFCCLGLKHACRRLKASLGGIDVMTRIMLFMLCASLAPYAVSKFTNDMNGVSAPMLSMPPVRLSAAPPPSAPDLTITEFGLTSSSAVLQVVWPLDSLAADSLVWIHARTNLVVGAWEPIGCMSPGVNAPPLVVEIPFSELPGATNGVPPSAAFFAAETQIVADTDRDGVADRDEVGGVEFGAELPEFDFSGATDSVSLFDAASDYWWDGGPAVPLPFTVWCGGIPSTNAVSFVVRARIRAESASVPLGGLEGRDVTLAGVLGSGVGGVPSCLFQQQSAT